MEFKIEYVRDDGRVSTIFIPADSESDAREIFVDDTGYGDDAILTCEFSE